MEKKFKLGPAKRLVKFTKDIKEKRPRSFSFYKTKKDLSEVLYKYEIDDDQIADILQFAQSKFIFTIY